MKKKKDKFDIALEHYKENNYSQALVAIGIYLEQNFKNKAGIILKAKIYRDLSNYNLALQILHENLPAKDSDKRYLNLFYFEIGKSYKEMGNYQEALKWFDKMIEIFPDETNGYIFKGACLASAGKYELAKIEHLKATKLKGNPEEAFYNLALISRAEMKFEEAMEYGFVA